jgi:N-acetylglucosamine-6-phosphate deacetylase
MIELGPIEEGKVADINILDKDMNLRMCIFNGDVIYNEL